MAWHLYRLGRAAFRKRWIVVGIWLAALAAAVIGAATLAGDTQDEFSIPGVESVDAFDLIKDRNPAAAPDGATARIVFESPDGSSITDPQVKQSIGETLKSVRSDDVVGVQDPYQAGTISQDGTTAYATVSYDKNSLGLSEDSKSALEHAPDVAADSDVRAEVGGDALQEIPETGATEMIGVVVALFVLLITFGSLIAAGMPLLTALIGVGIGVSSVTAATGFIDLGSSTSILATMLGLAVAIDYALFIVSRYRHEIHVGRSPEEAAGRAVGTAGSAVIFAGLTVIIALVGLSIVNISFLTQMGLAAAFTVLISVLIAITLLPALFGFTKGRIVGGKIPFLKGRDPEDQSGKPTFGRRWAEFVTHNRVVVFVVGIVAAVALAAPIASMQLALPDQGSDPDGSTSRQAYDLISKKFGAGANGPLMIVVDTAEADDPRGAVDSVTKAVGGVHKDVEAVVPAEPVKPQTNDPRALQAYQAQLQQYQTQLQGSDYAIINVVPKSGPADSDTQELVHAIRDAVDPAEASTGAHVLVTGQTAIAVDVSEELADAFPRYLIVVVGLAFILMTIVFRSLLIPLKAVVGFLVSVCVSLGATVAVFQWGWFADLICVDNPGPILSMLPLLLVGILFGLAMDYEMFLVTRMREEYVHGREPSGAIVHGFQYGARVVTAAAIIMISVFGSFALGDNAIAKSMGFGLAVGILADAFLVRMTLVPAFMTLLGKAAWWLPGWLSKILPNVDIEGDRLRTRLEAEGKSGKDTEPANATT